MWNSESCLEHLWVEHRLAKMKFRFLKLIFLSFKTFYKTLFCHINTLGGTDWFSHSLISYPSIGYFKQTTQIIKYVKDARGGVGGGGGNLYHIRPPHESQYNGFSLTLYPKYHTLWPMVTELWPPKVPASRQFSADLAIACICSEIWNPLIF